MTNDPHSMNGSGGSLERWKHDTLSTIMGMLGDIRTQQALHLQRQAHNKAELLTHLDWSRRLADQRISDLKSEIFPRFSRLEEDVKRMQVAPLGSASTPSLKGLLLDAGKGLLSKIPWGHIFATAPAWLLGLAGHLWEDLPEGLQHVLAALARPFLKLIAAVSSGG